MKRFLSLALLLVLFLGCSIPAAAVPAMRVKRVIKLADGTQKSVFLCGDENMHFYMDAEQNAYTQQADGQYLRADLGELKARWNQRLVAQNKHRIDRARQLGLLDNTLPSNRMHKAKWGAEKNPISGKKKGLVILVNFSDKKFTATHSQSFFDGYFNEVGFSQEGAKGSVHDYFLESSYGQFDLTFDVIGPVTVSKNMAYYGANMYGADMYPAQMVTEACQLADQKGVDFSQYDWDNDGYVDQVFVLYAGYGENSGGAENTIWPHESTLADCKPYGDGNGPISLDGVKVNTYAVSCELIGGTGTTPAGIGTACHEFSHCMCIPDMYDTNGVNFGMDAWDVMDYGSYNGQQYGDCPAPFTSYERMYCGWLTPQELTTPCSITDMPALIDQPVAYLVRNAGHPQEYYLLENRQQRGFGAYDAAHGLLVLHVDFDSQAWEQNQVNTSTQRMTIIPADNALTASSITGDTYPGKSKNTLLTDTSRPAATLNNANSDGSKYMGHPIEDITETSGTISFLFDGGVAIPTPTATEATNVTKSSFTAHWTPIAEANKYELQVTAEDLNEDRHDIAELLLLNEDFHGFNNGTTSNGQVDIASTVNDYTCQSGWEAQNIYTTPRNEIRIGSQKAGGYIISPWLPTTSKVVTVSFVVRSYSSDTEPVYLVMGEEDMGGPVAKMELTKEPVRYVVTASSDTNDWWWGLSCEQRCYVSEMKAYEGHLTEEDIEAGFITNKQVTIQTYTTTDTSYTLSDLSADKLYSYQVRALADRASSPWSNTITVTLPTTGIHGTELQGSAQLYDLQGRSVSAPKRGIYIRNGKKILVKKD